MLATRRLSITSERRRVLGKSSSDGLIHEHVRCGMCNKQFGTQGVYPVELMTTTFSFHSANSVLSFTPSQDTQIAMQSYMQYWNSLPVDHSERTEPDQNTSSSKRPKRETKPINPGNLPFDSSRLPVIARKRIRPPITPPRTPEPNRPSIVLRRASSSIGNLSPAPSLVAPFYETPQTPSFRSGDSSTPSGPTLLTPTSPSKLLTVRVDAQEETPDATPALLEPIPVIELRVEVRSAREDTPTPRISIAQNRVSGKETSGPDSCTHGPAPIIIHHVSSSGGPLAALRRYDHAFRLDPSLSGMSLFLNCPKKRVPFSSELQLAKYRLVAEAWRKTQEAVGESVSAA